MLRFYWIIRLSTGFKETSNLTELHLQEQQGHTVGCVEQMEKLQVKCVKCNKTWEKDSVIAWGPEDYSGSLCKSCFLELISPKIHGKQLKEGNSPCFRKREFHCDQSDCKYRRWCVAREEVTEVKRCKTRIKQKYNS